MITIICKMRKKVLIERKKKRDYGNINPNGLYGYNFLENRMEEDHISLVFMYYK